MEESEMHAETADTATEGSDKEFTSAETINIAHSTLDEIRGEVVRVHSSDVNQIHADEVELRQSTVREVYAQHVQLHSSAAVVVRGDQSEFTNATSILTQTNAVHVEGGSVVLAIAEQATLQDTPVSAVIAGKVQANQIHTTVLLASQVEGPVSTVLDTPRAMLAGLSAGIAIGLVLFLGKLFKRAGRRV